MSFRRYRDCLLGVLGICLLAFSTLSWGGTESRADNMKVWRDLGRLVLYQSGAGRSPSSQWQCS